MTKLGRRQVLVGAAVASIAAALSTPCGAVQRGRKLGSFLEIGEIFDIVYDAVDGSRNAFECVVVERRRHGDEWVYDIRLTGLVSVAGDVPLGVNIGGVKFAGDRRANSRPPRRPGEDALT